MSMLELGQQLHLLIASSDGYIKLYQLNVQVFMHSFVFHLFTKAACA